MHHFGLSNSFTRAQTHALSLLTAHFSARGRQLPHSRVAGVGLSKEEFDPADLVALMLRARCIAAVMERADGVSVQSRDRSLEMQK
jgi:hypothetical protein